MSLFLYLSGISLGQYCRNGLAKNGEFEKNKKGLYLYRGFKPSAHDQIMREKLISKHEVVINP